MYYVHKQPSDGYTWIFMQAPKLSAMIRGDVPYTLDDWEPVVNQQIDPRWLAKRADDARFSSIDDVIQAAKENPGEISVAGMGALGSTDSIVISLFQREEGVEFAYVPFPSTSEALAACLGGHTDLLMGSIVSFIDYVTEGTVDPMLFFWDERADRFPDVPACGADLNHTATYLATLRGFVVKKGTPPEIVQKIHDGIVKAMEHSHYQKYVEYSLLDIAPGYRGFEDHGKLLQDTWDTLETILKELGEI